MEFSCTQIHRWLLQEDSNSDNSISDGRHLTRLSMKYKSFENEPNPKPEPNPDQIEGENHL